MGQQASVPQPSKQFQVIGAGFSRTGTASFSAALSHLLDGPVYHGGRQTTLGDPIEIKSWIEIIKLWLSASAQDNESALAMMKDRLDGYVAVTDSPCAQFTPELLTRYPDAIVICTVPDPVAWNKSMGQTAGLATMWFLGVVLLLPTSWDATLYQLHQSTDRAAASRLWQEPAEYRALSSAYSVAEGGRARGSPRLF